MATSNTFESLKPLTKEVGFKKIKNLFRKKKSKLETSSPLKQGK